MLTIFFSALDFTSIGTALRKIAADLGGDNYVWIGSAYALTSASFLLWAAGLSHVFGRRPLILVCVAFFGVGSVHCGAAQNMDMLIAARAIQGVGGGGIISCSNQVVADCLEEEREMVILPSVKHFYWSTHGIKTVNLPILAVAVPAVVMFLSVKTPEGTVLEKLKWIDFTANALFMASATSVIIAMTWAGIEYAWDSFRILVPLLLGQAGMVGYVFLELYLVKNPAMPVDRERSRKQDLYHWIRELFIMYDIPVCFQAVRGDSAILAGVHFFPLSLLGGPLAIVRGLLITRFTTYKMYTIVFWLISALGFGLLAAIRTNTFLGVIAVYQLSVTSAYGPLFPLTMFPITAPLGPELQGKAVAFLAFTVHHSRLDNTSERAEEKSTVCFPSRFPAGTEIAYATIALIDDLPNEEQREIRNAFTGSLRSVWFTGLCVSLLTAVIACFFGVYKLHDQTDKRFGLQQKAKKLAGEGDA
ncbi:MFS general substrate transporter [Atractiella rhizophila]|nr:MFS general substrate transporter [Atractiella rhizophila]